MANQEIPVYEDKHLPVPEETKTEIPVPEYEPIQLEQPKPGHVENMVLFGDEEIEIKPTKLKYQRDKTAAFYRVLKTMPLVDIFALKDGILDKERTNDKMLFDWLVAVTDNSSLVARNYDRLDTETIEKLLDIFCRVNRIDEKEERKNREAQVKKA